MLTPPEALPQEAGASAARSWPAFWKQFGAAVGRKDRAALKGLMSSEDDFFSVGGGETRDEWIQMIDRSGSWREVQRSVASGTKPLAGRRVPARVTSDDALVFKYLGGRWRFVGVTGD